MNKKNRGFTTIELITSFTLASVIMLILFNIILILKDNLSKVNAKTNMLVEKDNLSYNINKRFKEKELSSVTLCNEGDKCYEFTYSDSTSDKLIYSNTDKTITFNNYTFDIIDGITVEEPTITEHYDTMSSTKYNGYFIIHIPIKIDNKDYSIKINKHFNTDSLVIDFTDPYHEYDNLGNRYKIVEYLESAGSQYIDTLYKTNTNSKVDLKISTPYSIRHSSFLFASRDSDFYTNGFGVYYNDSGGYTARFSKETNYSSNIKFIENENLNISLSKGEFKVNNRKIGVSGGNINPVNNLYIFGANTGDLVTAMCSYRLMFFKIYDNDTLVRDYIPVIDQSSRPCLFDKVSRECYYNQGTGEFLWG